MILHRLTNAIRQQDWFTVVIDIMIVVLGVFIGLHVNNWNAWHHDRTRMGLRRNAMFAVSSHCASATIAV